MNVNAFSKHKLTTVRMLELLPRNLVIALCLISDDILIILETTVRGLSASVSPMFFFVCSTSRVIIEFSNLYGRAPTCRFFRTLQKLEMAQKLKWYDSFKVNDLLSNL